MIYFPRIMLKVREQESSFVLLLPPIPCLYLSGSVCFILSESLCSLNFSSVSCMRVTSPIPVLELHALVNYHLSQFTMVHTLGFDLS